MSCLPVQILEISQQVLEPRDLGCQGWVSMEIGLRRVPVHVLDLFRISRKSPNAHLTALCLSNLNATQALSRKSNVPRRKCEELLELSYGDWVFDINRLGTEVRSMLGAGAGNR